MKYTIFVNQKSIVDNELHEKTNLSDWALIDYFVKFYAHPKSKKLNDHVWINLNNVITQMPMLKLSTKQSVSRRFKRLRDLGLITCIYDDKNCLYVRITELAANCVDMGNDFSDDFYDQHPKNEISESSDCNLTGIKQNESLPFEATPVTNSGNGSVTNSGNGPLPVGLTKYNIREYKIKEPNISKHMSDSQESNDSFKEFWEAYPRKENKKRSESTFKRLSKTKQQKAIADCKHRYKDTEKQFIPLPTTYLNGERWEDELDVSQLKAMGTPMTQQQKNKYWLENFGCLP